jgi:hypothetical protein
MEHPSREEMDQGEITVLLEQLENRIPILLDVKQRVLEGDTLSDLEIIELSSMLEHAGNFRGLINRHPELQKIAVQIISLYNDIVNAAMQSEKKGGRAPEIDLSD